MKIIKAAIRKNFDDLSVAEVQHKWFVVDCIVVTWIVGIIVSVICGSMLEPYDPTLGALKMVAFIFSFSSLFWAWRIAVVFRRWINKR